MTPNERIERAINFQEVDRVPIVDWIQHSGVIAYYAGINERKNEWTKEEAAKAARNALDMVQDITPSYKPGIYETTYFDQSATPSFGVGIRGVKGFKVKMDFWTYWIIERPFRDIEGLIKFIKKDVQQINRKLERTNWKEEEKNFKKSYLLNQELLGDTLQVYLVNVGLENAYNYATLELFTYLHTDEPDLISEWLEALNKQGVAYINHFVTKELYPWILIYSDIASTDGLIFSPEFLRKELIPRVKNLTEDAHNKGVKVIYHSEGYIMDILDDLISAGVNGINPLEPLSNMSLKAVRKKYPKLILWGGVDNTQLLPHGTTEEVKVTVERAIECASEGGVLLGSSGQIHPACKLENCITMIETIKNIGYLTNSFSKGFLNAKA